MALDPTAPGGLAVSDALRIVIGAPAPRFVYVHTNKAVAPDGSLSEAFPSLRTGRQGMVNLAMHPSGQAMWASFRVSNGLSQQMRAFAVAPDGNVTDLGNFGPAHPFANVIAHPAGNHFYAPTAPGFRGNQLLGVFGFEGSTSLPRPASPCSPAHRSRTRRRATTR